MLSIPMYVDNMNLFWLDRSQKSDPIPQIMGPVPKIFEIYFFSVFSVHSEYPIFKKHKKDLFQFLIF